MDTRTGETRIPRLPSGGTRDGRGAGDHDAAYEFGRRPTTSRPYPFTLHQFARLLILRSKIQPRLAESDDRENAHPLVFLPDGVWVASAADFVVAVASPAAQ